MVKDQSDEKRQPPPHGRPRRTGDAAYRGGVASRIAVRCAASPTIRSARDETRDAPISAQAVLIRARNGACGVCATSRAA